MPTFLRRLYPLVNCRQETYPYCIKYRFFLLFLDKNKLTVAGLPAFESYTPFINLVLAISYFHNLVLMQ